MKKPLIIILKTFAFVLGLYLLYKTMLYISWEEVVDVFKRTGLQTNLIFLVHPVAAIFHVIGLYILFPEAIRKTIRFIHIYWVRLVGDALNHMTPFVDIGGDPLKAYLLYKRKISPLKDAVVGVWVSRVGFVLSEIFFVIAGAILLHYFYPSSTIMSVVKIGILITLIYLAILIFGQTRGAVHLVPKIRNALSRFSEIKSDKSQTNWNDIASSLKEYYGKSPKAFIFSVAFQLVGWAFASFEVYLFFLFLGYEINWVQILIFQSLLQVLKTATFFIPGNLGAQEGGLAYLALHLGFSAADGFALSLIKRVRQLVWILIGLLFWTLDIRGDRVD